MTDKPIMIDDVDVSECEFYNNVIGEDAYCNIDEEHLCTCISYDNCYYKQLKRLENEYEGFAVKYTDMEIALKAKKQECDQLKAENEKLDTENKRLVAELANPVFDSFEELDKYKQALQEIKEIAEDDCKTCTVKLLGEDEINCKRCYKTKILQKCEVLNGNQ